MIDIIKTKLLDNSINLNEEFKRLFHGRGGVYQELKFLTIDSIDKILSVAFYKQCSEELENKILNMLKEYIIDSRHTTIVLQRRYIYKTITQIITGNLPDKVYAIENNLKFVLNLTTNQNSGYFPDMKNGRRYIQSISANKKVLNLFAYTCGFSLAAISGNAQSVVNIDMSKSALSIGRTNHHINNLDTKKVKFFPYNILKSFSRIKKLGAYDIVIIDPPTFQKGSFEASKDYIKIIKKLESITTDKSVVLAALNSPDLNSSFIIDLFNKYAPTFRFDKRLSNPKEFEVLDNQKSLKNLVFVKQI